MLARRQAFRISYYSLGLAILTIVGIPVGCAITSQDNSGWDYLSDDIRFLSVSTVLIVSFLLVSLFSGAYALKQHRIAAIWIIPLAICFFIAIGYLFFGLYIYIFDPYGIA